MLQTRTMRGIRRPTLSALIVEPRCHVALPLVVANMLASLPGVPVQVLANQPQSVPFKKEALPFGMLGVGCGMWLPDMWYQQHDDST